MLILTSQFSPPFKDSYILIMYYLCTFSRVKNRRNRERKKMFTKVQKNEKLRRKANFCLNIIAKIGSKLATIQIKSAQTLVANTLEIANLYNTSFNLFTPKTPSPYTLQPRVLFRTHQMLTKEISICLTDHDSV